MLKKSITYVDYDGVARTEDFYFNLSKAELVKLSVHYPEGLKQYISDLVVSKNLEKMLNFVDELIVNAYGKKSPDGRRFIKSDEIREEFTQTEAYSALLLEFLSDETGGEKIIDFFKGIIPKDMVDELNKQGQSLMLV